MHSECSFLFLFCFVLFVANLLIFLCLFVFVCSFVCLFVCLFIRLFVCLFVCLFNAFRFFRLSLANYSVKRNCLRPVISSY